MVQFYNEYQNVASIWQRPVAELGHVAIVKLPVSHLENDAIMKRTVSQLELTDL